MINLGIINDIRVILMQNNYPYVRAAIIMRSATNRKYIASATTETGKTENKKQTQEYKAVPLSLLLQSITPAKLS